MEKFIHCFPEAANSDQIFRLIDVNGDGVLSCEEIMTALADLNVDKAVSNKVYELLD
jgi:Ca2+-binding EF-hand superfamily protein